MGFIKYLFSYILNIGGVALMIGAFLTNASRNVYATMLGNSHNGTFDIIIGIVGFVIFILGFYMRKKVRFN